MEHLVQFTFSVDDTAIQRRLEESAYRDVVDGMREKLYATLPTKWRNGTTNEIDWRTFANENAQTFFEEYKAEIIDAAAKYLADRLAKTKVAKGLVE